MTIPFRYPVTNIGLPNYRMHDLSDGTETIQGLTAEAFCELYWLLKGLEVHYVLVVPHYGRIERRYSAQVGIEPHFRFEAMPGIYKQDFEGPSAYGINLHLSAPRVASDGTIALNFSLEDADLQGHYCLSTQPPVKAAWLIENTASLFGRPLKIYLSGENKAKPGLIQVFSIKPL